MWQSVGKVVCIIACLAIGFIFGRCDRQRSATTESVVVCDTVTYVDTVRCLQPIAREVFVTRYDTVRLETAIDIPTYDTIVVRDSASVVIPISQSVYSDSTYTAWISGYHASLDSIYVYSKREVVTVKERRKRWHIGVSAGYGLTPKGLQPYVGLGLTYSIIGF
jgi:hypothetical protein